MATKMNCTRHKHTIHISSALVLLCTCALFAVERKPIGTGAAVPERFGVFRLKHISGEQGRKYLAQAGIGTVSQLPDSDTLLVTAQSLELIKARTILELVDSNEPFVIKTISPAQTDGDLPTISQIEAQVGDILIGDFSNPPSRSPVARVRARTRTMTNTRPGRLIDQPDPQPLSPGFKQGFIAPDASCGPPVRGR